MHSGLPGRPGRGVAPVSAAIAAAPVGNGHAAAGCGLEGRGSVAPGRAAVLFFFAARASVRAFLRASSSAFFFAALSARVSAAFFAAAERASASAFALRSRSALASSFFAVFFFSASSASSGRSRDLRTSFTALVYCASAAGNSASSSSGVPATEKGLASALESLVPPGFGVTMMRSCGPFGVMMRCSGVWRAISYRCLNIGGSFFCLERNLVGGQELGERRGEGARQDDRRFGAAGKAEHDPAVGGLARERRFRLGFGAGAALMARSAALVAPRRRCAGSA
jgi:hypothetical protein